MLGGLAAFGRIHGLLDEYMAPIHYASLLFGQPVLVKMSEAECSDDNWDFFSENTPTLIAAIEVALNPPLPPRFGFEVDRFAWHQMYPPLSTVFA